MQGAWWGALMATWREIFSRNMGFWVVSRCFTKEMETIYSLFRFRQDVKRFYNGFKGNIYMKFIQILVIILLKMSD